MAESRTVTITGLSPTTTQASLSSFVGFCGQIESITLQGTTAHVIFVKESAAKTAELLNGASLDGSELVIHSNTSEVTETKDDSADSHEIEQEHKPRSAVVAELLAHGYLLSDKSAQKAIELDGKYGISNRFLAFIKPLHEQATAKAKELDQQAKISEKALKTSSTVDEKLHVTENTSKIFQIGKDYYSKALSSPVGAKVLNFYTMASKQTQDIHEEAKRIAEAKKGSSLLLPTSAPAAPASTTLAPAATADTEATPAIVTTTANVPSTETASVKEGATATGVATV